MSRSLAVVAAVVVSLVTASAAAANPADKFAPINRKGPELSIPVERLAAGLTCSPGIDNAPRTPLLLLASTSLNSAENFGWNWQPALTKAGIPWCAVDIPSSDQANHNMEDVQVRGEYVTYAIRSMHKRAKRPISTLGLSQGGMVARWALRFWPDTREMVDDVIGMGPTNRGTELGTALCADYCAPSGWQQRVGSHFYQALNSYQETFAGISYTVIRSDLDPLVPPVTADLTGPGEVANVRVQEVCQADTSDHLQLGTIDPVAEAVVMDALGHPGPARPDRIDTAVCQRPFMSGVNPETFPAEWGRMLTIFFTYFATAPKVREEPPLACYTTAAACVPRNTGQ